MITKCATFFFFIKEIRLTRLKTSTIAISCETDFEISLIRSLVFYAGISVVGDKGKLIER